MVLQNHMQSVTQANMTARSEGHTERMIRRAELRKLGARDYKQSNESLVTLAPNSRKSKESRKSKKKKKKKTSKGSSRAHSQHTSRSRSSRSRGTREKTLEERLQELDSRDDRDHKRKKKKKKKKKTERRRARSRCSHMSAPVQRETLPPQEIRRSHSSHSRQRSNRSPSFGDSFRRSHPLEVDIRGIAREFPSDRARAAHEQERIRIIQDQMTRSCDELLNKWHRELDQLERRERTRRRSSSSHTRRTR